MYEVRFETLSQSIQGIYITWNMANFFEGVRPNYRKDIYHIQQVHLNMILLSRRKIKYTSPHYMENERSTTWFTGFFSR